MNKSPFTARPVRRGVACAWSLVFSIAGPAAWAQLSTAADVPTTEGRPDAAAAPGVTPAAPSVPAADAAGATDATPIVTRIPFNRGAYKPGIERLRVVRRQNTLNNVAAQVALNVLLIATKTGAGVSGFSKDNLAGDDIPELAGNPLAVNPALSELNDALSRIATRLYTERAAKAQAEARTDGSTPEEVEAAGVVPKVLDTPLHPHAWHLVYENLPAEDGLYRLKFGAEMGRAGFMRPPMVCAYESEPVLWADWQADGWRRLREERAKAVARCTEDLGAHAEKRW